MTSTISTKVMATIIIIGFFVGFGTTLGILLPQLDATRSDLSKVQEQLTKTTAEIARDISLTQSVNTQLETEVRNLTSNIEKIQNTNTGLFTLVNNLSTTLSNSKSTNTQLETDVNTLSARLNSTKEDLAKVEKENIRLTSEIDILREEYGKLLTNMGADATTVFEIAKPAVVSISVYNTSGTLAAIGSGFVYSKDGYIVTNSHVAEAGVSYLLTFLDGSQVEAKLVGNDPLGDIAVLKATLPTYAKPLQLANSNNLKVGSPSFAMGSPVGLIGSITSGIVSQLNRTIPTYSFLFYIQTDAPINPGNSGGPLLNAEGKVIGINTFGYDKNLSEGLGFAIPSNILARVVPSLIEKGTYQYPLIGIQGRFLDPFSASAMNLSQSVKSGWLVEGITAGSGASKSNLKVGDIIIAINNYQVTSEQDISYILNQYFSPNEPISIKVLSSNQIMNIQVVLGAR
ncbi:MAG TPA: trypsin-like peptidase domain-containing protein [Nitrososphaerales archaeon]